MLKLSATKFNSEQAVATLITIYQALAVVMFLLAPYLAYNFFKAPFIGAYIDNTMVVSEANPMTNPPANWDFLRQSVQPRSQILTINNQSVRNYAQMHQALQKAGEAGETSVVVVVRSPEGVETSYTVALNVFTLNDQFKWLYAPYLTALVYLVMSLWIFGLRRTETAGIAFTMFATSAAMASVGLFDVYTSNAMIYLWSLAVPLIGASLLHLALVFPQEARLVYRYPVLRRLGYIAAGGLAIWNWTTLYNVSRPLAFLEAWRASYVFVGVCSVLFFSTMLYRWLASASPVVKRQALTILAGAVLGFGLMTVWFLSNASAGQSFNPFILLPIVLFPLTTGSVVLRSFVLRTDYIFSRSFLYGTLTLIAIITYIALTMGVSLVLGQFIPQLLPFSNQLLVALTVFGSVLLLTPVRERLQQRIDAAFFRNQRAYQERTKEFTRLITSRVDTNSILRVLRENIQTALIPERVHLYTYDAVNDQYIASADENGRPSSDIRFSSSSPLPSMLSREKLPVFINQAILPANLSNERARLALLGASLFVPMPGQERLIGWLALGERRSGEQYTSQDLEFLQTISAEAAVSIERSQVVTNMERRVQELNALARIAQGINITLNFDDILELIYAQTMQVVPGSDFHLTLYNPTGQYFYYAFCLEDEERIERFENAPIPPKTSLDQEVMHLRRAIVAQDYLRECQVYNVTPTTKNLYAWIGVPLNAGAETIGALSVASRDPNILYTSGQLELLQAIADQAAGAIVKARLLQETERRAQQLSTLNNISRQLSSTLDIDALLQNILQRAVGILNTEAGTLFLADEQTGEMIFSVVVGGAQNLVGVRLPPGSGIVGRAVNERHGVIVNEAQTSNQFYATTDKQTGFQTKSLLAVPMQVKDRVTGVIEIINKRDGLPFNNEDETLLSAFASQAAVALENARLFTMTDQALAARVEELSIMQRISRELNASLEVDRAMRITLEWAMRQSEAEAGMIGIIEDGVRIMAQQGYGTLIETFENQMIPLDHPAMANAIESGQPHRTIFDEKTKMHAFLDKAHSQLVIPIRRESRAIGLFLLESTAAENLQEAALEFLSRLADVAAIAIANSQLYAQVQYANNAKSQFVSFVAHELKNPMASIKGYTDLVVKGMAGPVNDQQGKFLGTVLNNLDRMNTIVTDLNDLSKIEAGKLRLDFKDVEIPDLMEDAVRSIKNQIDDKQQNVQFIFSPELPRVWGDKNRISQILVNLVSNANKYTPKEGQIVVGAERTRNVWDERGPQEVVHVWVKDTGIGIPPEDQKNIFQQYYRTESSKDMAKGTGLGLNISKSFVEMQGGKIWFDSEVKQGTTFHFTIPISEN